MMVMNTEQKLQAYRFVQIDLKTILEAIETNQLNVDEIKFCLQSRINNLSALKDAVLKKEDEIRDLFRLGVDEI
jgi:hypothetical protein